MSYDRISLCLIAVQTEVATITDFTEVLKEKLSSVYIQNHVKN